MKKSYIITLMLLAVSCMVFSQKKKLNHDQKQLLGVYYEKADYLFKSDNFYPALAIYVKMLRLDSLDEMSLFRAGVCYIHSDEKEKSISYLLNVYKKDPNAEDILYYLGRAYHINYQFDKAIDYFKQFIATNPAPDKMELAKRYIEYSNNAKEMMAKPRTVKIENVGAVVNTPAAEYAPIITADESELIYTYLGPQSTGGLLDGNNQTDTLGSYNEDIFISRKVGDNWTTPEKIDELDTKGNDASIAISADGNQLFTFHATAKNGGDIYVSTQYNGHWSKPEALGPNVNTKYWEGSCSLAAGGKTLFFASSRPGGIGGRDLYQSNMMPDGSWGKAINLGPNINSPLDEDAPFITTDGITLFFSSEGWKSMGGSDIFYSNLNLGDSTWSTPTNVGYPINSPDDDRYYVLNANSTKGYFSSNRKGGFGQQDLYTITPGIPGAKPMVELTIGTVSADGKPAKAEITVSNAKTGKVKGQYHCDGGSGDYIVGFAPGITYKIVTKIEGAPPHVEYLNLDSMKSALTMEQDVHLYSPEYRKANNITTPDSSNDLQTKVNKQIAEFKAERQHPDLYEAKVYQQVLNQYANVDSAGITYDLELGVYQHESDFDSLRYIGLGDISRSTDLHGNIIYSIKGMRTMLSAEILKYKAIKCDTAKKKFMKVVVNDHGHDRSVSQFYIDEYRKGWDNFVPDTVPTIVPTKILSKPVESFNVATVEVSKTYVLSNVFFNTGNAVLRTESNKELDELADVMNKRKTMTVEIAGYTDNVGSDYMNKKLSQQRADAVRTYLIQKGIDGARVAARGYGSSKPVADNSTDDGRQKNRRAELTVIKQ